MTRQPPCLLWSDAKETTSNSQERVRCLQAWTNLWQITQPCNKCCNRCKLHRAIMANQGLLKLNLKTPLWVRSAISQVLSSYRLSVGTTMEWSLTFGHLGAGPAWDSSLRLRVQPELIKISISCSVRYRQTIIARRHRRSRFNQFLNSTSCYMESKVTNLLARASINSEALSVSYRWL